MEQNLSLYRIFFEVAQTGNISRAAKNLYISQPAISKAISKLEDNLHLPLFIRNSRGVQLTEEGAILFEHVRAAFEMLDHGEDELKRMMDSEEVGGAPLLGAAKPVIKAHGSSHAKGIKNAIRQAKLCVANDLCGTMQTALAAVAEKAEPAEAEKE